jgi:hypothetical protein
VLAHAFDKDDFRQSPGGLNRQRDYARRVVSRRQLPPQVFEAASEMLWRGVELQEPLGSMLSPTIYSAWTLAPDFVSDEALARIRFGNLEWEGESQGTWKAILDYVVERMRTTGAIWVVPDSMARTTDPAFDP